MGLGSGKPSPGAQEIPFFDPCLTSKLKIQAGLEHTSDADNFVLADTALSPYELARLS